MAKIRCYANCTEKQKKFVDLMAKGYIEGDRKRSRISRKDAYVQAGYKGSYAIQDAHDLYHRLKDVIDERRNEIVSGELCPTLAVEVVNEIMLDETQSGSTRLKAAQDILTRAGYDKPTEIITTTRVEDVSDQELDEEFDELMAKAQNVHRIKSA